MKYPENVPLTNDQRRNIEYIVKFLSETFSVLWYNDKFEKSLIKSINNELINSETSILNIKNALKSLKTIIIKSEGK